MSAVNRAGYFLRRLFGRKPRCAHDRVRCVHGDEINHVGGKRSRCLDCGRYLPDLPETCSATGGPH